MNGVQQVPSVVEDVLVTITTLADITIPPSYDDSLTSVPYTDENLHTLYAGSLPDRSGIELVIVPNTEVSGYLQTYVVLRGKYEYKRSPQQTPLQVIYVKTSDDGSVVRILDKTVEELSHYYYSVLVLCEDDEGIEHYRYNELTSFASAYRFKDYDSYNELASRLPAMWLTDEFTERFLQIFAYTIDAARSDIDAYLPTNVVDVQEKFLPYLAHTIGWEVNRELNETDQRKEVQRAIQVYKSKGTNTNLSDMVFVITGWTLDFEAGYDRVLRCGEGETPDSDSTYQRSHINLPWRNYSETLDNTDGTSGQVFTLSKAYAKDVTLYISGDAWLEVDDFSDSGASDQHFVLNEFGATRTITLGNGVNGVVPASELVVTASYKYAGDSRFYVPAYPESWRSDCGTRVIVQETDLGEAMTAVMMNKVIKIVNDFKPSHSVVSVMFVPLTQLDETPLPEDDYDAYVEVATLSYITDSTVGETGDLAGMVVG